MCSSLQLGCLQIWRVCSLFFKSSKGIKNDTGPRKTPTYFLKSSPLYLVTIMKDKDTRKSKGVAFILFLDKESAQNCSRALNNKQLFGRVIKASIAIDNGRAAEFIRRRNYFDKSKCYECGEAGHLSYACPKNMLGEREPPKKKEKKKRKKIVEPEEVSMYFSLSAQRSEEEEESEEEGEDPALDSLSQAIAFQLLCCLVSCHLCCDAILGFWSTNPSLLC
ncbi:zinc finger CCHC-type and RNA-binding motif-containing protein 1 isoform X4 [Aptenodytes patagonicus]|uniref:zinc finger CCHC-type and RNA-binding motif-containing protein 1 isoform X4 n=1 Tax=Aptenodytes patagonicus TaxID=9234 RepID=UPI003FA1525F